MPATTNANYAQQFFGLLQTTRGSVVTMSDSNALVSGEGWDAAVEIQMRTRYGLWATPPICEYGMENHGHTYRATATVQAGVDYDDIVGALAPTFDAADYGDTSPGRRYGWVRQDTAGSPTGTTRGDVFGISVLGANGYPFDLTKQLRFHIQVAEFRAATAYNDAAFASHAVGTYRPSVRQPETSGSEIWRAALQTCSMSSGGAGSETWLNKSFTIPAGTLTQSACQFTPGSRSVFDLKSDVAFGYYAIEASSVLTGARCCTLAQQGGSSLSDAVTSWRNTDIAFLKNHFRMLYQQPNATVTSLCPVCIRFCFGTNDQNETDLDANLGLYAGSTEDGYYNNLVAFHLEIVGMLSQLATDLGTTLETLRNLTYIWVDPTPRLDSSYLSFQQAFARAATRYALNYSDPSGIKIFATDYAYLTNDAYLVANYYASGGTDKAHGRSGSAMSDVLGLAIKALLNDGARRQMARRTMQL